MQTPDESGACVEIDPTAQLFGETFAVAIVSNSYANRQSWLKGICSWWRNAPPRTSLPDPDLLSACKTSQRLIARARRRCRDSITAEISDVVDEAQIALRNAVDVMEEPR